MQLLISLEKLGHMATAFGKCSLSVSGQNLDVSSGSKRNKGKLGTVTILNIRLVVLTLWMPASFLIFYFPSLLVKAIYAFIALLSENIRGKKH